MSESPFPLSEEDYENLKAEFFAQDPEVVFVVDDEPVITDREGPRGDPQ